MGSEYGDDLLVAAYELAHAAQAVRYQNGMNDADVRDLVNSVAQPSFSSNGQGDRAYHFYIDGRELIVTDGDWLVEIAGALIVLSDEAFSAGFALRADG